MASVKWTFKVSSPVLPNGEAIAVIGNKTNLGSWSSDRALLLKKVPDNGSREGTDVWSLAVDFPAGEEIEYRYFTCIDIGVDNYRNLLIRKLETNLLPRKLKIKDYAESGQNVETFGSYNGETKTDRGWITHEVVLQFKLAKDAIRIHKKKVPTDNLRVKLSSVNLGHSRANGESHSIPEESLDMDEVRGKPFDGNFPIVEVAVMNGSDYLFKYQEQFGADYNSEDLMIFQCQVLCLDSVAFLVDIYSESHGSDIPCHVGYTYIMPQSLPDPSIGDLNLTVVNNKHHPIGNLKDIRENTLASLQTAALHGADYLEYDVQLSKDLVPVVYHDFFVNVLLKKNDNGEDHDKLLVPVKDLTLKQLQGLKFLNKAEEGNVSQLSDTGDDRPFPTLEAVMTLVDEHVGMNVELKWNMQRKDGTYELEHPFDLNLYVDKVVSAVLRHGGKRKIVFSCFHPDICVMLRLKQHKYPVLFLTQGVTDKWMEYRDVRTSTITMATYFALNADILGINVHAEDILRDPNQVKFVKNHGLTMFCWGEDNNDPEVIRQMKKLGLDGIIYDKAL